MHMIFRYCTALAGMLTLGAWAQTAGGDIQRGAQAARTCVACHTFAPGRHMTGPSLAGVWGRKAGTAEGFARYSEALKRSAIVWDQAHLDAWLANPAALVPGNEMRFAGIKDAGTRKDLLAYLEAVSAGKAKAREGGLPDLKQAPETAQVTAIHSCGDSYRVVTADGKTHVFWEFNLRFKSDSSKLGPAPGKPVVVGAGMQGDRAAVVFARFEEISSFVRRQCA